LFVEQAATGELEADESYFGARRVRGKRGRGSYGKTIVFGLLKRGDCVYTEFLKGILPTAPQGMRVLIQPWNTKPTTKKPYGSVSSLNL